MSRILYIGYVMNAGGAETFIMKLFRSAYEKNIIFDFLVMGEKKGYYDDEISAMGGNIYHIPSIKKNPIKCGRYVYSCIKEHKYKRVLLVTEVAYHFLYLLIARMAGAKIIAARSACAYNSRGKIKNLIHSLSVRCMRIIANRKVAPSIAAGKFLFGEKFPNYKGAYILRNGLSLDRFKFKNALREKIRKELCLNNIVIGHVGRFAEQKNHAFLIDVFVEYSKERDCTLLLVGDGKLREEIESKVERLGIRDKVVFAGIRSDVESLLMAMDVVVFPSYFEGMPNVIIEAQTTGLPCIVSNTVTEECKVTSLVSFMSLRESVQKWCKQIDLAIKVKVDRKECYKEMADKNYDIKDVRDDFLSIMDLPIEK